MMHMTFGIGILSLKNSEIHSDTCKLVIYIHVLLAFF